MPIKKFKNELKTVAFKKKSEELDKYSKTAKVKTKTVIKKKGK